MLCHPDKHLHGLEFSKFNIIEGRGGACFVFCTIKVNVINNQKFVLGPGIFSALLSKVVGSDPGSILDHTSMYDT